MKNIYLMSFLVVSLLITGTYCSGSAKKASSFAGTAIQIGLAGHMIMKGLVLLRSDDEEIEKYSVKAPDPVRDFVLTLAQRENVPDHLSLDIRLHRDPESPYSTKRRIVFIDITEAERLAGSYATPADQFFKIIINNELGCSTHAVWQNADYRARCLAMLTHEMAHIKKHDNEKTTFAHFAIPMFTLLASRYKPILSLINKSFLTKVASGVVLHEANEIIFGAFSRVKEYRADDSIREPDEMLAFIKELHTLTHAYPPNPSIYGLLKNSHPDMRYRILRILRRLEEMHTSRVIEGNQEESIDE